MPFNFNFTGEICDANLIELQNCIGSNPSIDSLNININSNGGSVAAGVAMYNYLKQQNFPIHTHNLGEVSSAAILLYLAGNTRTAAPISKFMIHPPTLTISGSFHGSQIEEFLKGFNADVKNYAQIVINETNSLQGLHDVNTYLRTDSLVLTPEAALACGIVTG